MSTEIICILSGNYSSNFQSGLTIHIYIIISRVIIIYSCVQEDSRLVRSRREI